MIQRDRSDDNYGVVFGLIRVSGGGLMVLATIAVWILTVSSEDKANGVMQQGVVWLQMIGCLLTLCVVAYAVRGVLNGVERLVRK